MTSFRPRINHRNPRVLEVDGVAGGQSRPARQHNAGDHGVPQFDWLAMQVAAGT